jgi:hypothetical protein
VATNATPKSFRHKSGRYYARAFSGGKEVWKSLKTSHFSVAEAKLAEFLRERRERVSNRNDQASPKMTFSEAAAIHLRNLNDNPRIKPRTRDYWRECLAALQKSGPGLSETEVCKITQTDCKECARPTLKRYCRSATTTPFRFFDACSTSHHISRFVASVRDVLHRIRCAGRFIVHAHDMPTAFLELHAAIMVNLNSD